MKRERRMEKRVSKERERERGAVRSAFSDNERAGLDSGREKFQASEIGINLKNLRQQENPSGTNKSRTGSFPQIL